MAKKVGGRLERGRCNTTCSVLKSVQRRYIVTKRRNSWACRQSEPRAGNHQRHTHTRNASLPTQANHTVRGNADTRVQHPHNPAMPLSRGVMVRHAEEIRNWSRKPARQVNYKRPAVSSQLPSLHSAADTGCFILLL